MIVPVPEQAATSDQNADRQFIVGWREWVSLPALIDGPIRAKVDTGARTSALHARNLSLASEGERTFATFTLTDAKEDEVPVTAEVVEQRSVRSSNGGEEIRPVILVDLVIGSSTWPIELTLTDRELMGFPMLVGRSALRNRCLIDPNRSYCAGTPRVSHSLATTDHQRSGLVL